MMLYVVLGGVVVGALGVFGYLFFILSKETELKKVEPYIAAKDEQIEQLLKTSIGAPAVAVPSSFELEKELAIKEAALQRKVDELQKELQDTLVSSQEQSQEALKTIEELKSENEKLKNEEKPKETDMAAAAKMIQHEQEVQAMRDEQAVLQNRLNESQLEIGKLQEEESQAKFKMAEEVLKFKTEAELLTVENYNLKKSVDEGFAKAVEGFQQEMNILKEENEVLKLSKQELTTANQQLNETSSQLLEKSEALQWELTKMRAQTTSFERSSENYQAQLQEALNQIKSLEKDLKESKLNTNAPSNLNTEGSV